MRRGVPTAAVLGDFCLSLSIPGDDEKIRSNKEILQMHQKRPRSIFSREYGLLMNVQRMEPYFYA
jgi:hypothetical protein